MTLDPDTCYRALSTRDARFDGRFFVAVRTTGVYCRPICPARTPKRENCEFVQHAAAAYEAGFRPCLRCRPEASPGTPAWQGTSATVSRALRLIGEGALDDGGVDQLALRLGVGERHLRRLFHEHLGATPIAVAQTRRLHFAKKLIDETSLPMSEIAFSAGFSSIRRFNDAVRETWQRSPRELRKQRKGQRGSDASSGGTGSHTLGLTLRLPYRKPFDWAALTDFLALRAIPGVEQVERDRYRRSFCHDGIAGSVDVEHVADRSQLRATLRLAGGAQLIRISERLRALFDLTADPEPINALLRKDPALRASVRRRPGLRVPGAWDGFELGVRAILGQQVSVRGATTLAGRIAATYGEPLPAELLAGVCTEGADAAEDSGVRVLFPKPEALVDLDPTRVGLTKARARAISGLAEAVLDGRVDWSGSRGLDESIAALCALPGIGPWTAHYVAMRALREPDAFPSGDLGLRHALATGGELPSERQVEQRSQAWRPWRAYAALHLWSTLGDAPLRGRRSTNSKTSQTRATTRRKKR